MIDELKRKAVQSSEAQRLFAEGKSLRQGDNPEQRKDLYAWTKPEDTLEWKAALRIRDLEFALENLYQQVMQARSGIGIDVNSQSMTQTIAYVEKVLDNA